MFVFLELTIVFYQKSAIIYIIFVNEVINVGNEFFNDINIVTKDRSIQYDSYYKYIKMIYELGRPMLTVDEEKDLFERIYSGDQEARNILVESNLRLVVDVAKKLSKNTDELIDNIQNGNIGLMIAVDKYDITKGARFSTYATWWIYGKISNLSYNDKRIISLPFSYKRDYTRFSKAKIKLQDSLKREPTIKEIADYLGESVDFVNNLENYFSYNEIFSLDASFGEFDEYFIYEVITNKDEKSLEDVVVDSILSDNIENILRRAKLDEDEIKVLKYRNGYYNNKIYSLQEIGRIFGVTRERIRQIEVKALKKIRINKNNLIDLGCYLYDSDQKVEEMANKVVNETNDKIAKDKEKDRIKNAKYRALKKQNK